MENCIFCKVASKQIPHYPVYEDENVLAFLDIAPTEKGHTLVIPKKHFSQLAHTPDNERLNVFRAIDKIRPVLTEAMGAWYTMIMIAGIDQDHFHVHLIPKMNDAPKPLHSIKLSPKEFEEIRAKIVEKMPA